MAMFTVHGDGVSNGIVIGQAQFLKLPQRRAPEYKIKADEVASEIVRLQSAIGDVCHSLKQSLNLLEAQNQSELAGFVAMHLAMLEDSALLQYAFKEIKTQQLNVFAALAQQKLYWREKFDQVEDEYLRNKSTDTIHILELIENQLHAADKSNQENNIVSVAGAHDILIADDISPALAVELRQRTIGAFLTRLGGPVSHTAILARGMHIPAIVGLHDGVEVIQEGDYLIVDGRRGVVIVNPDQATVQTYEKRRSKILWRQRQAQKWTDVDAVTLDGHRVALSANLDLLEDVEAVVQNKAESVGLLRTEFLYLQEKGWPDEQRQFTYYADIIRRCAIPVTIRTFDIGADKAIESYEHKSPLNPALGLRALRLGLRYEEQLRSQLRAILRAANEGHVKILLPMVTNVSEVLQVKRIMAELQQELDQVNVDIPLGVMIEVPAVAMNVDLLAPYVDFFSIGTNDLIQYTLAIDRGDDDVNYLYDPLHPAVLRLLKVIMDTASSLNKPVTMCGEMASNPIYTPILLWLGLRELSMDPGAIQAVKRAVCMTDISRVKQRMDACYINNDFMEMKNILYKLHEKSVNEYE